MITGASLVTLWFLSGVTDLQWLRQYGLQNGLLIFAYAACVWAAGLILVASVPWAILHYNEKRSWRVAVALGALLTFVVTFGLITNGFGLIVSGNFSAGDAGGPAWVDSRLTLHGWADAFQTALVCSAAGALVGLVVWRTAYRRVQSGD